jgi:hypothetical protein
MPALTESERAALWVNQRIHELNVRKGIATKLSSDPTAIAALYRDWEPVLAHLEEHQDVQNDSFEDYR